MHSTNPREITNTLHLIRASLACGLLSKEEVIDWACEIVEKDECPDIFFIDLALSSSKSINEVVYYFSDYLNFENPVVSGRPILGLLAKRYFNGQITYDQAIRKLFGLKLGALFNEIEEGRIYSLDNDLDCATEGIYGTLENVQSELEKFLSIYKDYTIYNFEKWEALDKVVDSELGEVYKRELQRSEEIMSNVMVQTNNSLKRFLEPASMILIIIVCYYIAITALKYFLVDDSPSPLTPQSVLEEISRTYLKATILLLFCLIASIILHKRRKYIISILVNGFGIIFLYFFLELL